METETIKTIAARLLERREWLACAESCTGGLIAKRLTDFPGSSQWFERGVVTYSDRAKLELLGVPASVIAQHGAVSGECAQAMALGLLARAPVHWTLAITGIAGPTGGSPEKPVGTVWIACAHAGGAEVRQYQFRGSRRRIRSQAADAALAALKDLL